VIDIYELQFPKAYRFSFYSTLIFNIGFLVSLLIYFLLIKVDLFLKIQVYLLLIAFSMLGSTFLYFYREQDQEFLLTSKILVIF
jgi:hypothetical protein